MVANRDDKLLGIRVQSQWIQAMHGVQALGRSAESGGNFQDRIRYWRELGERLKFDELALMENHRGKEGQLPGCSWTQCPLFEEESFPREYLRCSICKKVRIR